MSVKIENGYTGVKDWKRWVIVAANDGGFGNTIVDLLDVIAWVKENRPELLDKDPKD